MNLKLRQAMRALRSSQIVSQGGNGGRGGDKLVVVRRHQRPAAQLRLGFVVVALPKMP
ncbi:MAG: hypothetical protein OXN84_02695 [Albidovulum sp.]|nr:hypothetical protein [Albidovulum sp.]